MTSFMRNLRRVQSSIWKFVSWDYVERAQGLLHLVINDSFCQERMRSRDKPGATYLVIAYRCQWQLLSFFPLHGSVAISDNDRFHSGSLFGWLRCFMTCKHEVTVVFDLSFQNDHMSLLTAAGLSLAVSTFVDKHERDAIEKLCELQISKTKKHLDEVSLPCMMAVMLRINQATRSHLLTPEPLPESRQ